MKRRTRPAPGQRVFLCGMDCCAGQRDLFDTDGPPDTCPGQRSLFHAGRVDQQDITRRTDQEGPTP